MKAPWYKAKVTPLKAVVGILVGVPVMFVVCCGVLAVLVLAGVSFRDRKLPPLRPEGDDAHPGQIPHALLEPILDGVLVFVVVEVHFNKHPVGPQQFC